MNSAYPFSRDKLFEKTYQNLRIGIFRIDPNGLFLEADDGLVRILRYPNLDILLHTPFFDIWEKTDNRDSFSNLQDKNHEISREHISLRTYDGVMIRAEMNVYAIRDPAGRIVHYEGTLQDISERNLEEERLWQAVHAVTPATGDSFFSILVTQLANILSIEYVLVAVKNQNSEKIHSLAAYIDGQIIIEEISQATPDTPFEQVLKNGLYSCKSQLASKFPNLLNNNHLKYEAFAGVSLLNAKQDTVGLLAIMSKRPLESTGLAESMLIYFAARATAEYERRQIQERLELNERRFRVMTENSAEGIMIVDTRLNITYISSSCSHITGFSPGEYYGKNISKFIHPEDLRHTYATFKAIIPNAGQVSSITFRVLHEDGSWSWVDGSATNLLGELAVQGIVLNFRDVTQQKNIDRMLQDGEKELHAREEFDRLILGISIRLINVPVDQMVDELNKALGEVGHFTGVDRSQLFLFSSEEMTLNCIAEWNREGISGPFIDKLQNIPIKDSPWILNKLNSQEVFYITSSSNIPLEGENLREIVNLLNGKSSINVPIVSKGHLVGYLSLLSIQEERKWSDDEIKLQRLLAEIIANALERQNAETRIKQQMTNLAALHKIGKAITSKTEIGSVMNVVLEQVTIQLGMDAAVILLYDNKTNSLYFGSGRGFKPGRATTALRYLQNPLLEKVVAGREMIHMSIPQEWQDIWGNEGLMDYFGVPLIAKGEVNGVLELYRRQAMQPSEDWLAFMYMVAETSAIAIDNVSLFQKQQRARRDLEQAYESTLESWARMLELRDQETELHSKRVVDWTIRLARLMGIDGETLTHLRHGALLHDIGKIFIPSDIFIKTGALTLEEWIEIKKHPEYAYRLLSPIQFLRPALDIVYCHHELWDGSGYPRGLKGEEIPLSARIFTVIDVWDALTQERPYRLPPERKWEKRRAMEYLRDQAGKKFDPRVVRTFLHMLESDNR